MKSTKYAICSIIELINRLGSLSVSTTNSNITFSAIDKALHRHQNHSLPNLSALNYLKRKVNSGSKDKTTAATRSNKKNCRVCRDHFKVKEPQDSTKCPHLTTIDRKRPHEQKSGGNGVTDKNDKELLVLNNLELLVSNPTGIQVKIEKVHKNKLINLSNIIGERQI